MIPQSNIYSAAQLNWLPFAIRAKVTCYAPLLMNLNFKGVEPASFTRSSSSSAVWRDGFSHTAGANIPRFEWQNDSPIGLALNTATETLQFSSGNALHDLNSLFWIADDVHHWAGPETNPFNSSGVWTGASGIHLSQVIKFNSVLNSDEKTKVDAVLSGTITTYPAVEPIIFSQSVSQGATSAIITHGIGTASHLMFAVTNWLTDISIGAKGVNSTTIYFSVAAPTSATVEGSVEIA